MAFSVIRLGFEPKTHSLEGCCSIQLSYRTDPYFLPFCTGRFRKVAANIMEIFEMSKYLLHFICFSDYDRLFCTGIRSVVPYCTSGPFRDFHARGVAVSCVFE